jgi:ribosomal protein S12 methylthiotransferase accessory factor
MQFQNHVRNEYNKCDTPENTIHRIQQGFNRLSLQPEYTGVRVSEFLHWGRVWIDSLQIVCEGKGISPKLAEASAHAELTERLSAGLYYPVFEEQVRFHLPGIYSPETTRFLNYEWMEGYVRAHQRELDKVLTIEELLRREGHLSGAHLAEIKDCEMAQHWVDGYSLLREETVKVPIKFMAYIHGSNGIAAGNTIEEAMIQASCEILERYAQISVVKPETIVPSIDPASVTLDLIHRMMAFYTQYNVSVTLKDLSFDGTLPVIGVFYTNRNLPQDRLEHRSLIAGASFNLEEALARCFTEGMQGKKTLLSSRPQFDRPVVPRTQVRDYYTLMRCGISPTDISFLGGDDGLPCMAQERHPGGDRGTQSNRQGAQDRLHRPESHPSGPSVPGCSSGHPRDLRFSPLPSADHPDRRQNQTRHGLERGALQKGHAELFHPSVIPIEGCLFIQQRPSLREEISHPMSPHILEGLIPEIGIKDVFPDPHVPGQQPAVRPEDHGNPWKREAAPAGPHLVAGNHKDPVIKGPGRQMPHPAFQFFLRRPPRRGMGDE